MKINIGDVVRTPRWNYDQPKWVIATVSEIVTGYEGTVQYRVEDSEGDSQYMCRDDFEIVKSVPGVGWISVPAYNELTKLVNGVDNDAYIFSHWDFNQYFIPSLVAHLNKIGRKEDAAKVQNEAMSLVWTFDNGRLQAVQHRNADVRPGVYFTDGQEFHGEAGWETIRDLCIPVVMQYR